MDVVVTRAYRERARHKVQRERGMSKYGRRRDRHDEVFTMDAARSSSEYTNDLP